MLKYFQTQTMGAVALNCEHVLSVMEKHNETMITLVDGRVFAVLEPFLEVVARINVKD